MNASGTAYLYSTGSSSIAATSVIGAKARSLQQMTALGFPVPPGFILATGFFQPWFDAIQQSPAWASWSASERASWPALCAALRAGARSLPYSDLQAQVLADLSDRLATLSPAQQFAVRSSSPDEDAQAASFAGLYDTHLGVAQCDLSAAIRDSFAACLDYRVFAYKAAQGLDPRQLRFALIIQVQIDSDVAGVGFSINPLTNDFDEAVIDANWGLGESVVAGVASPDHFVIDKTNGTILKRILGAKQVCIALTADGVTTTAPHPAQNAYCLNDVQLAELTCAICDLESKYGHPVDMEWAYSKGTLFILQARPVTSYVPLAAEMMTRPGDRRTLYMDVALSKGMTSNAPVSPMGLDWLAGDIALMVAHCIGKRSLDVSSPTGLLYLGGTRMYMNLSLLLWFSKPAQLAKANSPTDQLMAETLAGIDPERYRSVLRPAWTWPALRTLPVALWRLRRALWRAIRSVLAPENTHRLYLREKNAFERRYSGPFDHTLSLRAFQQRYGPPVVAHVVDADMPALGIGVLGVEMMKYLVRNMRAEEKAMADRLTLGIGGNLVVDMGIRIHRMAKMLDADAFDDLAALAARVQHRQLAPDFLTAWDRFVTDYGCRGPGEMDMANLHYADDPMLVLRQMSAMARSSGDFDPGAAHQQLIAQRRQAYNDLAMRVGWGKRVLLKRANTLVELFGGTRDTPKQHNLMYQHAARSRLLSEGRKLVEAGRIDRPEQVFDLSLSDLHVADTDAALDLRAMGAERTGFGRTLTAHVRAFPAVIDSRGRIHRPPPRPASPDEMRGIAVSPGMARGRVKVMRNAHEKSIDHGDVLVAYTTDPGWTPLFVNAAAVVLEVGGVLQHGAVVAREFGKPCVAAVPDVLTRFVDGQMVEVDGNTGVIRFIADETVPLPSLSQPAPTRAAVT